MPNNRRVSRMLASLTAPLRIVFGGRTLDLAPGRLVAVPSPVLPKPFRTRLEDVYSVQLRCPAEAKRLAEMFERGGLQEFIDRQGIAE
jgi:hypothetical protein